MAVVLRRRRQAPRSARPTAAPVRHIRLAPDWPFTWLFLGFPLWWALGLGALIYPVFAVVMAAQLLRRPRVRLPRGFGLWCLFLIWALGSVLVLHGSALAFGYRTLSYLSITVVFLWVYNTPRDVLDAEKIVKVLVAFFFIVLAGGWLGVLVPGGGFSSPVEALLPKSLTATLFVHELVHPSFAQVQDFLGYPVGRPKAPFAYTNDWGSAYALLCPLFFALWLQDPRRRRWGYVILALSLVPVFISLNRGLWLSLGVALLYAGTRPGPVGGFARKALASLVVIGLALLLFTPLSRLVQDRAVTGHSNSGRQYIYSETFDAVRRSPLIGYGGPLHVDSSRILPDLGTQGLFWTVLVSQGLVGTALFLGFLFRVTWATRRGPPLTFWAHVVLIVALVQLPVYDMTPSSIHIVFIVAAMGLREIDEPDSTDGRSRRAPGTLAGAGVSGG